MASIARLVESTMTSCDADAARDVVQDLALQGIWMNDEDHAHNTTLTISTKNMHAATRNPKRYELSSANPRALSNAIVATWLTALCTTPN